MIAYTLLKNYIFDAKKFNVVKLSKSLLTVLITFFSLNILAQIPNYIPTSGLLAWYPFNGNSLDEGGKAFIVLIKMQHLQRIALAR